MPEVTDRLSRGGELPGKFQMLTGQLQVHVSKSGGVTTRMGEALNESYADWIAYNDEHSSVRLKLE